MYHSCSVPYPTLPTPLTMAPWGNGYHVLPFPLFRYPEPCILSVSTDARSSAEADESAPNFTQGCRQKTQVRNSNYGSVDDVINEAEAAASNSVVDLEAQLGEADASSTLFVQDFIVPLVCFVAVTIILMLSVLYGSHK